MVSVVKQLLTSIDILTLSIFDQQSRVRLSALDFYEHTILLIVSRDGLACCLRQGFAHSSISTFILDIDEVQSDPFLPLHTF